MIIKLSPSDWKWYFDDRGISEENSNKYIKYIKKLNKNNCPVVFEFDHLSKLFGIKRQELAKMVNSPESFYRTFSIPKQKGGSRNITSPYPSLLHCQRWIYRNILLNQKIHPSVHGFTPNRSIISNATEHISKKVLLKMDLENFFPSIPINWVINLFHKLGYAKNVAFYLASLCCYEGYLNQGSATSPYLTNILLRSLDGRLNKLSESYNLKYTRYADDLTFSGEYIPFIYIDIVKNIISDYGLNVNDQKTKLHLKPGQRIVTGISVSGDKLRLPREAKREIKNQVHFINKYGFVSHINKLKINNPLYLDSLYGKVQFWLQIEPECEVAIDAKNMS